MLEMLEKGGVGVLDSLRGAGDLLPYPLVPLWSSQFEVSNPLFDEDSDDLLPVNTKNMYMINEHMIIKSVSQLLRKYDSDEGHHWNLL